jgi:hypothetical protein
MKRTPPSAARAILRDSCKKKEEDGTLRGAEPLAEGTEEYTMPPAVYMPGKQEEEETLEPKRSIRLLHVD